MKLGFIGAGNMARAIINGLLKQNINPADILIHSAHQQSYEPYAKQKHLTPVATNSEVVSQADIVFLAVKPLVTKEVLTEIADTYQVKKPILVSMVTGVSLKELSASLQDDQAKLVRIMSNVNVENLAGMTALKANSNVPAEALNQVQNLFNLLGETCLLEERDFSTFVALAGSSPAYVYLFIDAMSRSGVKYGLKKEQATNIAAQAVLGSALQVLKSTKSPMDLADDVCSPGGTTVAGLLKMEEYGFTTAVIKGLDATIQKDQGK